MTAAERKFRVWMLISAWMYALSGTFFFVAGFRIAPLVNGFTEKFLPMPLYPLPSGRPEGAFWLVLSLSMMAMITYICRAAYLDIRRNGRLVPILLLSKFFSTAFYLYFFATQHQAVYLVGAFTDGPLFFVTLALWVPASPGDKYIDEAEEEILAALGDALMPRGGPFQAGYLDHRDEYITAARCFFAPQDPATIFSVRLMLRTLDILPVFLTLRPATLRRLTNEQRQAVLHRIENSRFSVLRMIFMGVRLFVLIPFFTREENAREVGYLLDEGM